MGASTLEAHVGAVLDDLRTIRVRFWAPILLGLIMLFDSWDSIAIAYVMPSVKAEWHMSPVIMGVLISAGYAGQFVGAIVLGAVAERAGRMPVFLASMTVMSLLAIATAFASGVPVLLVLRFCEGLMIGGALPIAVSYINELAPTKTRGRYFALFQVLCMAGYAAASVSSTWIIPHLGWRWLFGLGGIPLLFLPLVALTLPESPRWLARAGRLEAANRALAKLGGRPVGAVDMLAGPIGPTTANHLPLTVLFRQPFLMRTMTVTILWFLTAFANFGLTTWVPSIYVTVFHIPVARALRYSSIASAGFLVVAPTAGLVMDRVGRRPIAILGAALAAVTMLGLAIQRPSIELLLVGMVIVGQLGVSCVSLILWPYTAESYPTDVRALGLGYGSSIARAASMLTPLLVGVILQEGGSIAIVFAVYGACALGSLATWVTRTRETAGLALDSI